MSAYGSSSLKFFESGFLLVGTKLVLGLNNISLDYAVETEDLLTFDFNKVKSKYPTFSSFTISASGEMLALTSDSYSPLSGDSRVTGATNGFLLLEAIKLKTEYPIVLKIDGSNYQTGNAIITSFNMSADAGSSQKFSIELTGTSDLTKATS